MLALAWNTAEMQGWREGGRREAGIKGRKKGGREGKVICVSEDLTYFVCTPLSSDGLVLLAPTPCALQSHLHTGTPSHSHTITHHQPTQMHIGL